MRKILYYCEIVFGIFILLVALVGGGSTIINEGLSMDNVFVFLCCVVLGLSCIYNAFFVQRLKIKGYSIDEIKAERKKILLIFCIYKPKSEEERIAIAEAKEKKRKEKLIQKNNHMAEKTFKKEIKTIERSIAKLKHDYSKEIQRINKSRWMAIGSNFKYNMTEGKIKINSSEFLFSDIQCSEINVINSERVVTVSKDNTKLKSKKHASIGGAAVGGLLLGPVGMVAGGVGLAKTKTKGSGTVVTTSDVIPTCTHIGVKVKVKNYVLEIPVLSSTIDQSKGIYRKKINEADSIVSTLLRLSGIEVPKTYLMPYQEPSVVEIQRNIDSLNTKLEIEKEKGPIYVKP